MTFGIFKKIVIVTLIGILKMGKKTPLEFKTNVRYMMNFYKLLAGIKNDRSEYTLNGSQLAKLKKSVSLMPLQ